MWNLAGSGMEPMFPALADGFLSTVPLGKSKNVILKETVKRINVLNQNIWSKQKLQSKLSENGTRRIHLVNGAEVIFIIFCLQTHAYRTFKMPYFGRYSKKIGWINACYCMTPIFSLPVSFFVCLHCAFEGGCFVLYYCFKFKLIFHFLAMPHGM